MTAAPKRDARAVLAIGGLLLVPLAALWLLLAPARDSRPDDQPAPRSGGGRGTGIDRKGTPILPAAPSRTSSRVAAGAPTQADWTLLALTFAPRNGLQTPPGSLAAPAGGQEPAGMARNAFLQVSAGAIGLWISVRGGTGVKTLTIPQDSRRRATPFGPFFLVSTPIATPSGGHVGV